MNIVRLAAYLFIGFMLGLLAGISLALWIWG
jgi:hypothetical protein